MKSLLLCLVAAAALTIGMEGALGNPSAPSASHYDADEEYEYSVPAKSYDGVPAKKPSAPSSSSGDYGY